MATVQEVLHAAQHGLIAGVQKYKHLNSDATKSSPAAPNTGSFTATRSSMVEIRKDHRTYDGMFVREWPVAAIVGSLHEIEVSKDIYQQMVKAVQAIADVQTFESGSDAMVTAEDGKVFLKRSYGTNYTSIGARAQ